MSFQKHKTEFYQFLKNIFIILLATFDIITGCKEIKYVGIVNINVFKMTMATIYICPIIELGSRIKPLVSRIF